MKSKLCYLLMGALTLTLTSCETENVSDDNDLSRQMSTVNYAVPFNNLKPCAHSELLAGKRYDAGDIKVYFDEENLYVEYQTSAHWFLRKTHVFVGDQRLVPLTRLGSPNYQLFPLHQVHNSGTETAIYTIAKSSLGKCFIVTAYAEVCKTDNNGDIVQIENAWSMGERFNEESWGMYFDVCQSDCSN